MKTEQPILAYMLGTLFIGLKLTGHIDWAWGWVLTPIWFPLAFAMVKGFLLAFGIAFTKARAGKSKMGTTRNSEGDRAD